MQKGDVFESVLDLTEMVEVDCMCLLLIGDGFQTIVVPPPPFFFMLVQEFLFNRIYLVKFLSIKFILSMRVKVAKVNLLYSL